MKLEENNRQRKLFGIAIIAILVATLSFRLLLIVENSLISGCLLYFLFYPFFHWKKTKLSRSTSQQTELFEC